MQSCMPHHYRNAYCGIVSQQTKTFALTPKRTSIPRFACEYATTPKQNLNNCEDRSDHQKTPTKFANNMGVSE